MYAPHRRRQAGCSGLYQVFFRCSSGVGTCSHTSVIEQTASFFVSWEKDCLQFA